MIMGKIGDFGCVLSFFKQYLLSDLQIFNKKKYWVYTSYAGKGLACMIHGDNYYIWYGVAYNTWHAALGHNAGVKVSAYSEPVREAHTVLFLEAGGNQQHSVGIWSPWTDIERHTEVADVQPLLSYNCYVVFVINYVALEYMHCLYTWNTIHNLSVLIEDHIFMVHMMEMVL